MRTLPQKVLLESSLLGIVDPRGLKIPVYLETKLKKLGIVLNEHLRYSGGLLTVSKHPEATLDLINKLIKKSISQKHRALVQEILETEKKISSAPLAYACELIKLSKTLKADLVLALIAEEYPQDEFLSMFKNRRLVRENALPVLAQYFLTRGTYVSTVN